MPLAFRDSLLQEDYKANLRFLDSYASKHGFSDPVRQRYARYLLFRYHAARLDFTMKDPGKAKAFLKENGAIHGDAAKLVNCDTCFAFPDYPYLTKLFAKAFVADPASQPVDALYKAYAAFFTGKAKDYLLYDLIKAGGMFNRTRPNPALAERFLSDAKDPALKNYIKETYAFLALKKSEKGLLAGVSGAPVSWSQLLEKHKGKVIYVDFWASWCAPCRSEMPASHDLQKQFAGKEVVFVYVSLDENSVDWKKASHAERIHNGERFIITQPEKFDLGKAYRITSIPRYFLIDKSGKIVNDNASRPSDQQIVKEIQLLL
jgi:thiol-disulfide isomerase/thioredoxin